MSRPSRVHFVYLLRCGDGTLYCGSAKDPLARAAMHNRGRGARYTRGRRPVALVFVETLASIGDALRREYAIKQLTRAKKEALIASAQQAATAKPRRRRRPAKRKASR